MSCVLSFPSLSCLALSSANTRDVNRWTDGGTGSIAAAFQSVAYAGFTPAGGVFATLTSMGMLGALNPAAVGTAMGLATGVAVVTYLCGVGR